MRPPLTHAGRAVARQYAAPLALVCTVGPGRPRGPRQAPYLVCHRQTGGHASGQRRVSAPTPYAAPAAKMAATSANYRHIVPSGCAAAEAGVRRGGQRRPRVRGCRRSAPRSSPRWAPGRNARRGAQTLRGVRRWPSPLRGPAFLRHCGPAARPGARAVGPWARAARCSGRPAPAARSRAPPPWPARARPLSAVPAPPGLAAVGGLPARLRFWGAGGSRSGPLLAFGWPPAWFPAPAPPARRKRLAVARSRAPKCRQKVIGWTAPTGPG